MMPNHYYDLFGGDLDIYILKEARKYVKVSTSYVVGMCF